MNQSTDIHKLANSVFLDGFSAFSVSLSRPSSHWFLSHYHADHYTGLKKGSLGRRQVKGTIHCTRITRLLLERVHFAVEEGDYAPPPPLPRIVSHEYNVETTLDLPDSKQISFTFLNANHCPGAAVVAFRTSDAPRSLHVHCGDMRYHPSILASLLALKNSTSSNIGTVYLDTTYGHPKHTFCSQSDAVSSISSSIDSRWDDEGKTLFLLSCYSIGKEKVLHAATKGGSRKLYVTERKREMLQCISDGYTVKPFEKDCATSTATSAVEGNDEEEGESFNHIVQHTTKDPLSSHLHVVPMSVAGSLFPYYLPDYRSCASYADSVNKGQYDKIGESEG